MCTTGPSCCARCARTTAWKTNVACSTWCSASCPAPENTIHATRRWPAAWSCSEGRMRKAVADNSILATARRLGRLPPDNAQPEPALPQFAHITRYWDSEHTTFAARLMPGEYYVTRHREMIATVLGSCVSACIRDSRLGYGGMNHFMLPLDGSPGPSVWGAAASAATRYGNVAMERLINDILKLGGRREDLEIKLVGGGRVLAHMSTDIGA